MAYSWAMTTEEVLWMQCSIVVDAVVDADVVVVVVGDGVAAVGVATQANRFFVVIDTFC
jgi:hypothetical protein